MEIKTKLDERMQKELMKNVCIFAWIFTVLGGVALLAYIVVDFVPKNIETTYLMLSAVVLVVGVCLFVIFNNAVKACRYGTKENCYTFGDEYFEINTLYHGESQGTAKLYYSDIYKVKESKNYIFIYPDNTRAYPVLKSEVEDIERLRSLLNKFARTK